MASSQTARIPVRRTGATNAFGEGTTHLSMDQHGAWRLKRGYPVMAVRFPVRSPGSSVRRACGALLMVAAASMAPIASASSQSTTLAQASASRMAENPGGSAAIDSVIVLFDARKYPEAKAIATRLFEADSKDATAAYWLGRIAYVERKLDNAASWFEKSADIEPKNAWTHHWMGVAYGRQAVGANKFRQAILARRTKAAFERAIALDPDLLESRQYLLQYYLIAPGIVGGSMEKARAQAAEITKRDPVRGHLARGAIYDREENAEGAEREYLAAIKAAPDSLEAYYGLALMYQRTKQYARAFDTYERVLVRRPTETRARYLIGRTAAISGERLDRAEQTLREYLRPRPDASQQGNASAHYLLGVIYEKRGDAEAAKREYDLSKKMDPQQAEARTIQRLRDS